MADVLLARTDGIEGFERHVVLKQIRSEHAKDQRFIQMFLDEARVAASLHHANIVQVHDIGQASGEYFFAMEYIHGEDLRQILKTVSKNKTHMPLQYVCAIVSAAAAGLHYAHERRGPDKKPLNIVHRDVSPSNIIVTYDGSVKLVDFGIAKAALRQVETRSGSLKGKVSYMSPEQCKGDPIDRRSDVYALGVLLYELSTTTRLFKGENDYLLMDAIVNGKVPLPRVRRPDLPNELSWIIMQALSTDPDRRYQTADELRVALDQFALNANLTVSQSQLQSYMKKLFGERPEPWADLEREPVPNSTWTSLPAIVEDPDKTRTGSNKARKKPQTTSPPATRSRTSQNMGWEQHTPTPTPPPPRRGKWIAVAALPVVAAAGFGVWKFALQDRGASTSSQVVAAASPATAKPSEPTVVPIETPASAPGTTSETPAAAPVTASGTPAAAAPAVIPSAPAAASMPAPAAPASEPPPARETTRSRGRRIATSKAASSPAPTAAPVAATVRAPAPAPAPVPAAAPATVPAAAPVPGPAPALAKAPAAAPPPPAVVAAAPPPVELQIAQLSQATVQMIASDHSSQLGKCESAAGDVHGEVSVAFQIDGNGKVVKSQLSTSVKNPKLAGCILRAVISWKFPRPPTGAAKGLYSIDYQ